MIAVPLQHFVPVHGCGLLTSDPSFRPGRSAGSPITFVRRIENQDRMSSFSAWNCSRLAA